MKSAVTVLVVLLFFAGLALAQDRPAITAQPNTVFVGADGKFEANPDTALVQFNISAQQDNSRAAYDQASKASEQVRQILRNNGIDPATAQIGSFSIEPVYDYKSSETQTGRIPGQCERVSEAEGFYEDRAHRAAIVRRRH